MNLDDGDGATVTYAQETVTEMVGATMYKVSGGNTGTDDALDVNNTIMLGATQDTEMVVTYMLTGMVFGDDLTGDSIELRSTDEPTTDKLDGTGQRALITGGTMGDDTAEFHISVQQATIGQTDVLTLQVESLGVMASGGSVKVTVRNTVDNKEVMAENMGMVMFETGVKITNDAVNAKTYVARNYRDFGLIPDPDNQDEMIGDLIDDVGNFMVGTQHLAANDGLSAEMADVFGAVLTDDMITFDDDWFGFLDAAWLDSMADCSTATADGDVRTDVWVEGDDAMVMPVTLANLGTGTATATGMRYLCLMAPGDEAIPATMYYTADTMFMGVDGAKKPHMKVDDAVQLGRIERDGITVYLPYLTASTRYVQRLVLVNRNPNDVAYTIEFANEGETTTDPKTYSGMAAGTGTDDEAPNAMISTMKIADIVEIIGTPPRTAGTLMLESVPDMVDVATTQINMDTSATDTIVYEAK
jgi:hypothetical protein